ncbi:MULTISPECIES: hypothetical protein [unclassified Microcoleus]|uniref:hypothetical protein n=1 Tax=unclassified Microcoleus TaxID=2642155 RepID=UPI002FD05FEE
METFNIQGARSEVPTPVPTPRKTQITEDAAIASGTAKLAAVSRSPAVRRRCYSLAGTTARARLHRSRTRLGNCYNGDRQRLV